MKAFAPFVEARTYRTLLFVATAVPLGTLWFGLLLCLWCIAVCFAITPLVVPVLLGLAALTKVLATAESEIARSLLGVDLRSPDPLRPAKGFWSLGGVMLSSRARWREQGYLLLRFFAGVPIAIALLSLLWSALWLIAAPIHYRWSEIDWGIWHIDTLGEAALLVPVGVVGLVLSIQLVRPVAALWRWLAGRLLAGSGEARPSEAAARLARRRVLLVHASISGLVSALLAFIWLMTTRGYFWPGWPILSLGLLLAPHAWIVWVADRPHLWRTPGTRSLTIHAGVSSAVGLYLVGVWAMAGQGYFWPAWVLLGLALLAAAHAAAVFGGVSHEKRIEELETTRAGAVDVHGAELRRIERDLHDGAQARLVALGMNLGMAEQKLRTDPAAARELLVEARAGAREALEELRDLARGIYPPVLADRGLEAAVGALASRTPAHVVVSANLGDRPPVAVESAAYFVVAEALANAGKHAEATQVEIRIDRDDGMLTVEVVDDGKGGADPDGSGLVGLRRRVQALDGTLEVTSPAGGPTTVRARMPCGS